MKALICDRCGAVIKGKETENTTTVVLATEKSVRISLTTFATAARMHSTCFCRRVTMQANKPEKPMPTPPAHSPAEEKPPAPTCCQTCNYYMPQSWTVAGRQCAVFGSIDGIRDNRCGARAPKPIA